MEGLKPGPEGPQEGGSAGAAAEGRSTPRPAGRDLGRAAAAADRIITTVLAIVVAAEAVILGFSIYDRWDLTMVKSFTVSEKTARILSELDDPVRITVFYSEKYAPHAWACEKIKDLLDEYERSSDRIEVEFVDPYSKAARAQALRVKYGISEIDFASGVVVFSYKDDYKFVTDNQIVLRAQSQGEPGAGRAEAFLGEEAFLTTILSLIEGRKPVAYVLSGHMEASMTDTSAIGFALAAERLRRDNFEVRELELRGKTAIPDDCDVVVMPGPQAVFSEQEAYGLREYLDRGGRALLLLPLALERGTLKPLDLKLGPVLDGFAISLGNTLLLDTSNPPHPNLLLRIQVKEYNAEHPVSKQMIGQSENKTVVMPLTRPVVVAEKPAEGISAAVLAWSPKHSVKKADIEEIIDGERYEALVRQFGGPVKPGDEVGPFPVAAAAERTSARADRKGRIAVVGNYLFASTGMISTETYNEDFLLNAVNWLTEREQHLGIEGKKPREVSFRMAPSRMSHIFWLSVVIIPLTALAFGLAVWIARRK